jgi:polyferredoxin
LPLGITPIRLARTGFQVTIVTIALVAGVRFSRGLSLGSVEKYCPFGGIETAWSFLTKRSFSCVAGEINFALFLALLGLTIVARRAFCGWICPVGSVSEWLQRLFHRVREHGGPIALVPPGSRADRALPWLRAVTLGVVLYFTYRTGELVFRGYDPYYILFSVHGHDVRWWSYGILPGIVALVLVAPMGWCRYLCPLGGTLWPFSRLAVLRLSRGPATCTSCRVCDRVCPQAIQVSRGIDIASGECTLCMECVEACPTRGTLELRAGIGRP